MKRQRQKLLWGGLLALLCLQCQAAGPAGTVILKAGGSRPERLKQEKSFYDQYVASLDSAIQQAYWEKWAFHDAQAPYALTSLRHEHLDPLAGGNLAFEADVRRDFAAEVFRRRLDHMLREVVTEPVRRSPGFKPVQRAMDTYQAVTHPNVAFAVGGGTPEASQPPMVMKMGYELSRDALTVEVSQSKWKMGIYQDGLFQTVTARRPLPSPVARVSQGLGESQPMEISLGYTLNSGTLSSSLGRRLSPRVDTALQAGMETRNTSQWSLGLQVAYQF